MRSRQPPSNVGVPLCPIGITLAYVEVDDIGAATRKAETLGAKTMKDSVEVPGMGWFSIITDPTGAMLGLWQTKR